MKNIAIAIAVTFFWLTPNGFAQTLQPPKRAVVDSQQIIQLVATKIASENVGAKRVFVGTSIWCDRSSEALLCEGQRDYKPQYLIAAADASKMLARAMNLPLSTNWENDVRSMVAEPVFDPASSRERRYHLCVPAKGEPPAPFVVTIRPSALRETKPGQEWRIGIVVNSDPLRGECMGGGVHSDYVVERDSPGNSYKLARVVFVGSGHGHIK